MKKTTTFILFTFFSLQLAHAQESPAMDSITVEVSGLKKVADSKLHVAMVNAEGKEIGNYTGAVSGNTHHFKMPLNGEKRIALKMFQDVDGNGEMNRSAFGMPSEPFGFSNNPEINFGPPSLKEMLVDASAETTLKIIMQ